MPFTPASWVGEKVSSVRVKGSTIRDRLPTEKVPHPVWRVFILLLVVLFFIDEFLILAAIFGGPIAFGLLLGFAASVWFSRRTKTGKRWKQRAKRRGRKLATGRDGRRYGRRKKED